MKTLEEFITEEYHITMDSVIAKYFALTVNGNHKKNY